MQVQSRLPSGLHTHSPSNHQSPFRANGNHSDSNPNYPSSTNHSPPSNRATEMHHYQHPQHQHQHQQQYAAGPLPTQAPPPQPQQRHYSANQLPPMFPSMNLSSPTHGQQQGMPGPSNVQHTSMYHTPSAMPQPSPEQNAQQQQVQQQQQDSKPKKLSMQGSNGKHNFELKIEQQPQRARMCGFGDKDRRPITPPPCIKLVVTDLKGTHIFADEVDGNFFVLQVDLWDELAQREVNIVRSSSSSPSVSISTATLTSFPPINDRPPPPPNPDYHAAMMSGSAQPLYAPPLPGYAPQPIMYSGGYYMHTMPPAMAGQRDPSFPNYTPGSNWQSGAMYTRNLIGSLTVNASVLKDPEGEEAFWFVLQDLSVRTEGFFRLKMNFINVGNPEGDGLNTGKAPVLASVFSDVFQVYSAKKFPGVIESTALSKCFAGQGIKIPIRKDVKPDSSYADDDDA